jgi:hypothetical protein
VRESRHGAGDENPAGSGYDGFIGRGECGQPALVTGGGELEDAGFEFRTAFKGSFIGILRWPQLDRLWSRLRADAAGGWYLYAVGEAPPTEPVAAPDLHHFINRIDELLRREHDEDYCGIVYADDPEAPRFVKIFDPNNLGVSCGYSDNPPLPGWILSKLPPVDLQAPVPLPGNRRRWWQRLFAS